MSQKQLQLSLAQSESDVRDAQRLRWSVFVDEMGACLSSPVPGLDIDRYDAHCDHILVRDRTTGEVVGTYRVLGPDAARRIGGFYTDQQFDLSLLQDLRGQMVELGRSCVHADYRSGGAITLLWAGLAGYLLRNRHDFLIGCASIGMADHRYDAAGIWQSVRERYISPARWRAIPRCPLRLDGHASSALPALPPLIKGYLRAGAYVCGEPAWDADFNAADLPMLLPMAKLNPSYARHFLHG
jgi:putative hemolysin